MSLTERVVFRASIAVRSTLRRLGLTPTLVKIMNRSPDRKFNRGGWSIVPMQSLLPARIFYAFDAALGVATGGNCPNCGKKGNSNEVVRRKAAGLTSVRKCGACGVLYRPVGFRGGRALQAYYSFLFTRAGVATARDLARTPDELVKRMAGEGKDRSGLVAKVSPPPASICVFGCSWGYEMLPLTEAGYAAFGVELSSTRREFGQKQLGLPIYASFAEAKRVHPSVDVLLSSHVLEHIPALSATIREAHQALAPRFHVHLTPSVERFSEDPTLSSVIGREHPLGVTRVFWEKMARDLEMTLEFSEQQGEALAVLRPGRLA